MGEEIDMAYSDRELLARLIECEAGGEGEKFEMEFEEVSKEIEVEPGTETFPADGAESADSDGEFKRP